MIVPVQESCPFAVTGDTDVGATVIDNDPQSVAGVNVTETGEGGTSVGLPPTSIVADTSNGWDEARPGNCTVATPDEFVVAVAGLSNTADVNVTCTPGTTTPSELRTVTDAVTVIDTAAPHGIVALVGDTDNVDFDASGPLEKNEIVLGSRVVTSDVGVGLYVADTEYVPGVDDLNVAVYVPSP